MGSAEQVWIQCAAVVLSWKSSLLLSYAALCTVCMAYASWPSERYARCSLNHCHILFVSVSLLVLFVARVPLFVLNVSLNPDEAQMIASAKKFSVDMNSWRSVDTYSGGPLMSMVLMWPFLLNKEIGFATARITGAVLIGASWFLVYRSLADSVASVRIALAGMLLLFFAGTQFPDYVHYTSEHLPLFLLAVAAFVTCRMVIGPVGWTMLLLNAMLLGALPYAKLQAAPIGVVLGVLQCGLLLCEGTPWKNRCARLVALVLGVLVPTVLIVGPLAVTDGLDDFWKTRFSWALQYVIAPLPPRRVVGMVLQDRFMAWYFAGCGVIIVGGLILWLARAVAVDRHRCLKLLAMVAFFVVSLYAVMRPGRAFPHYLLFLLCPVALAAGALWPSQSWLWQPTPPALVAGPLAAALLLFILGTQNIAREPQFRHLAIVGVEDIFDPGDLLSWLPSANDRVLIWGWMPEWYVYAKVIPATRDIMTYNQMTDTPLRSYFRSRLMEDFRASLPSVVVDAVAPDSFVFTDPRVDGIATFPALESALQAEYTLVSQSPSGDACPRTYVRHNVARQMALTSAKIKRIQASAHYNVGEERFPPELVNDLTVYEICRDRWLLPDGTLGVLTIELDGEQPVSAVRLLNTGHGVDALRPPRSFEDIRTFRPPALFYTDRATHMAKIALHHRGQIVFESAVRVRRYPYWTIVPILPEAHLADAVHIFVAAFAGRGGGLNEVRIDTGGFR